MIVVSFDTSFDFKLTSGHVCKCSCGCFSKYFLLRNALNDVFLFFKKLFLLSAH
jgi:hypothetical protein